jgi:hypothetical protein
MNRIWEAKLDERYDCFVERVDDKRYTSSCGYDRQQGHVR